jgi:hypothetical protein
MSLYQRLKLVTFRTLSEPEMSKTSGTSHARARRRGNKHLFSNNSDIRDAQTLETVKDISSHAHVTNRTLSVCEREKKVIAWINSNPPDLPEHQNNCAACGGYIPVHDTGWVILGDGALIHYSGKHGQVCWKRWHRTRRSEAIRVIEISRK